MQLGQEVPVGSIDQELKKLWESNEAATKASLMNFAIYSEAPGSLEENTAMIAEITEEHACRALVIFARPDKNTMDARAWITAHCRLTGGGSKAVCSEQIAFNLCGQCSNLIRNIVFANLESDLPLVVWWQGDLTDRFGERFFSRIDRLIVDSSGWKDPRDQIDRLAAARAESSARFLLHDLSWTRSFDLRIAMASLFDDTGLLEALPKLASIRIEHGPGGRVSAAMMMAWVAEMLGLDDSAGEGESRTLSRAEGPDIEVKLSGHDSEHAITSLLMNGPGLSISFALDEAGRFWHATGGCGERDVHRLFPALDQAPAKLVNDQLQRSRENSLLKRVIPRLESWL